MTRLIASHLAETERRTGSPSDRAETHPAEKCPSSVPRDPLYLFACHLAWRDKKDVKAYQELVAALDDCNPGIRAVAEKLLQRSSPRPQPKLGPIRSR
jgi:hypothetical protein